jgi:O-antigen ligase
MDQFLSRYTAFCVLSLFLGISYDVGIVLRPFDALVAAGGFILVGRASVRGYIDTLRKPIVYYLFAAAYFYRCLNGFFISGMGTAVKETIQVIEFILLVHLVAIATRTAENRRRFLWTLLVGSGVIALMTVFWHVGNGIYVGYKQLGPPKFLFSLFSLLVFGEYLKERSHWFVGVVLFVSILLTILSGERKGWVALVGGMGVMYVVVQGVSLRRLVTGLFRPRLILSGGIALAVVIFIGLQVEYVADQFGTMVDLYYIASNLSLEMDISALETSGSNLARLYILLFSIRTAMAHPFFGVGTGRWDEALAAASGGNPEFMIGAHSEYQKFIVENGLTGFVLYVWTWWAAFRQAIRLFREGIPTGKGSVLTILGVVVMGALINLFLGGGALNIVYMALAVGLLVGLENDKSNLDPK